MKGKPVKWTEELFMNVYKFIDKKILFNRVQESLETDEELIELELNKDYVLSQDLFGVKIENGLLRIQKIILDDVLEMLNELVQIRKYREEYQFHPIQNPEMVVVMTRRLGLELPDLDAIQGYIINHELVNFITRDYYVLQMKYKDNPENIFYIYKLYFMHNKNELFLVIEKNI